MMIKFFLPLFLLLFTTLTYGQYISPVAGPVFVQGQLFGGPNSKIYLINQNMGGAQKPVGMVETDEAGRFAFEVNIPIRDYYLIGLENGQSLNLILEPYDSIVLLADANNMLNNSNVQGSQNSEMMNQFLRDFTLFKSIEDSLRGVVQANPVKQNEVNAYFTPIAQNFFSYRNSFIGSNVNSPAIIATLGSFDQDKEWDVYKQIVTLLNHSFGDSPTIKSLLNYVKQNDSKKIQQGEMARRKEMLFAPGTLVKDIVMPDTSGTVMKLSDLRGKVVLIDFWASWCGPCRKENPNVVKAYNKYHADGFEVFSVSLDKPGARAKWIAAIKKDGLIWPYHVSELTSFNASVVKDYLVESIPFTVLIDANGKVIATNLRGPQLEATLSRIFNH